MDADRFDALARSLNPGSRRRVLGMLTGVALGALAPLLGLAEAEGKKSKGKGKEKGKGKGKGKGARDPVEAILDPGGCGVLAGLCGGVCCYPTLGQVCCKGQVCCNSGQGCADSGVCSVCDQPTDPCLKANCDHNGNKTPPFVEKCHDSQGCDGNGNCLCLSATDLECFDGTTSYCCPHTFQCCANAECAPPGESCPQG